MTITRLLQCIESQTSTISELCDRLQQQDKVIEGQRDHIRRLENQVERLKIGEVVDAVNKDHSDSTEIMICDHANICKNKNCSHKTPHICLEPLEFECNYAPCCEKVECIKVDDMNALAGMEINNA